MDFVGVNGYDLEHEVNESTNVVTLTLKEPGSSTVVCTVTCESYKMRSIFDSLAEVVKQFHPDGNYADWTRRTVIDKNGHTATTRVSAPL